MATVEHPHCPNCYAKFIKVILVSQLLTNLLPSKPTWFSLGKSIALAIT